MRLPLLLIALAALASSPTSAQSFDFNRRVHIGGLLVSNTDSTELTGPDTTRLPPGTAAAVYTHDKKKQVLIINPLLNEDDPSTQSVYYLPFKNREAARFIQTAGTFGTISIPFRYRFPVTVNDTTTVGEASTSASLGFFVGYKVGLIRYWYREGAGAANVIEEPFSVTVAGSIGMSAVTLKEANTLLDPVDNEQAMLVWTPAVGVVFKGSGNIQVGMFGGLDYGIGSNSDRWVFNGKPWFGFGIGVGSLKL